ncbi:MAG TPA: hypothetical protein VMC62_12195 [Longilinea sp.]|nr:hypothetical protein [Longilinea sp.]
MNAPEQIDSILHTRGSKGLDQVRQAALADQPILQQVLEGLTSQDDYYRYNCFQVMLALTEEQPAGLFSEWGRFANMLESDNVYHCNIGLCLLANLTAADASGQFEAILERFFSFLDGDSLIPARYAAQSAGKIARNEPKLQHRITAKLLGIEASHQKQKELLKSDVIQAFDEYFEQSDEQGKMLAFVTAQIDSSSPKTKKTAKAFLKKWTK